MNATPVGAYSVAVSVNTAGLDAILTMAKKNISEALSAMANATVQRTNFMAPAVPYKTGNLYRSGRVDQVGELEKSSVFCNEIVKYARFQEYGGDATRRVRHYTPRSPEAGAGFLQNAGESVAKEGIQKFL